VDIAGVCGKAITMGKFKIMKKVIFLFIILAAITEGCKKYPEGPWISFHSAKDRLFGTHTLTKYTVNGVDSLSLFNDSMPNNFYFYYEDVYSKNVLIISGYRNDGKGCIINCTWELSANNTILNITSSGGNSGGTVGTGPFGNNIKPSWAILKLKKTDIVMKTTYNGKEYLIELE